MKDKKVIASKNIARKIPLHPTLTLWLTLKVFAAPQWVWGAMGILVLILWIAFFVSHATYQEIETDIFQDK